MKREPDSKNGHRPSTRKLSTEAIRQLDYRDENPGNFTGMVIPTFLLAAMPRRYKRDCSSNFVALLVLCDLIDAYKRKDDGEPWWSGERYKINYRNLTRRLRTNEREVRDALSWLVQIGLAGKVKVPHHDNEGVPAGSITYAWPMLEKIDDLINVYKCNPNLTGPSTTGPSRTVRDGLQGPFTPPSRTVRDSVQGPFSPNTPQRRSPTPPPQPGESDAGGAASQDVSPSATGAAPPDPAQDLVSRWSKKYEQWNGKRYEATTADWNEVKRFLEDHPERVNSVLLPAYKAWCEVADAGSNADRKPAGTFDRWIWRRNACISLSSFLKHEEKVLDELRWETKTQNWDQSRYHHLVNTIRTGKKAFLAEEEDEDFAKKKNSPHPNLKRIPMVCSKCQKEREVFSDVETWTCHDCNSSNEGPNAKKVVEKKPAA